MNIRNNVRSMFGVSGVLCVLSALSVPTSATAQVPRDLIEEALDQPIAQLELTETPIRDALARIEQQTGLHFLIQDDVVDLMPYGARTRISLAIKDMSVRAGLTRVLDGLGLRMYVEEGNVVLVPAPVLERVGRRLSLEEVNLLGVLAGGVWDVGSKSFETVFRFDPGTKPAATLVTALAQVRGRNAIAQLESATSVLGWVWRPEGSTIVFESKRDEVLRRLDWPLDLTYQREPLDRLLVDLATQIGILMEFEPGALQQVSARDRNVDLIQRGTSVRQILERICGNTGLRYTITDEGVQIMAPTDDKSGPTMPTIQQWVRIEVEVRPGVVMDAFVRRDQLPQEIQTEIQRKLSEILRGE